MATTLDQLDEMGDFLIQLLQLDDVALQGAASEGFEDAPEWTDRLPERFWAGALLNKIANASALLESRLQQMGDERKIIAGLRVTKAEFRYLTPEENEALRQGEL